MHFLAQFVIAGLAALGPLGPAPAGTGGALEVSPRDVNLGAVGHRARKSFTFTVENRNSTPVKVARIKASCDCMKVKFDVTTPIAAGETRQGKVDVHLGRGFGKFDKYIDVVPENATAGRWKIKVRAQFHPGVRPAERKSSFKVEGGVGVLLPEARDQLILARTRATGKPIEVEGLRASTHHIVVELDRTTPDRIRFLVELAPTHPAGPVRGTVTAKVEGLPVEFPVSGEVFQGIRTKPSHFNFSRLEGPENATRKVELLSIDGREFEVEKVDVKALRGPAVTVKVVPRDGGGVTLEARPAEPFPEKERLSGKVTVFTTHPDKRVLTLNYFGFIDTTRKRRATSR